MKILIKVTKEVLAKTRGCGITVDKLDATKYCAIAEAVREIFPDASVHYNDNDDPVITPWPYGIEIPLPIEAKILMNRFDNEIRLILEKGLELSANDLENRIHFARTSIEPSSFEIDVPNEIIDLIGISEIYKILSESRSLELRKI